MTRGLHITNGDATGEMLKEIFGPGDEILAWQDVLHDGPLTFAPLETHRRRRARFLADSLVALGDTSWGTSPFDGIHAGLLARDQALADLDGVDAVTLWFEHDLYDQLQIAEILHRLAASGRRPAELSIVCIGHHPEVPFFHGLGNLDCAQLAALYPQREVLGEHQFASGVAIWRALCAADPREVAALLEMSFDGLPFMSAALLRFCQEYPGRSHGLTQSQYLLLGAIGAPLDDLPLLRHHLRRQAQAGRLPAGASAESRYQQVMGGPLRFGRIFLSLQTLESAPFMGDLWVRKELAALCTAPTPYIRATPDQKPSLWTPETAYALTPAGRAALDGHLHWAEVNSYDLWRGGVHLSPGQWWYWDPEVGFTRSEDPA
jgi:hypothetical protein